MAPLYEAITVKFSARNDTHFVYEGTADDTWTVGSVPNGGYILALIIQACIDLQTTSNSPHKDPVHVTSHFLQPNAAAPFQIFVKKLRSGKGFSHLTAEFIQDKRARTTAHLIFGDLTTRTAESEELVPPSPYARRHPLHSHPSKAVVSRARHVYTFSPKFAEFAIDKDITARNLPESSTRTNSSTIGGGGLEWGTWVELKDRTDRITPASLAFLADVSENMTELLYRVQGRDRDRWYPSLALTLEFKFPIPQGSESIRTIGVYSKGTFVNDPQGRHDMYTEVWTAPSNIGEGQEEEGWRDKQRCLVTSTQMALTVPFARNMRQKGKL